MTIEEEIFENTILDFSKMEQFGFTKQENSYRYETMLFQNEFEAIITVLETNQIIGKVIDIENQEEFSNFRIQNIEGSFSNKIKEEYIRLLEHIKEECFHVNLAITEWVIPANLKLYDVIAHFEAHDTIDWRQTREIGLHDIIYIYVGAPISAILFQCEVVQVHFPSAFSDTMELKVLQKYEKEKYPLEKLRQFGLTSIRCTRKLSYKTSRFLRTH